MMAPTRLVHCCFTPLVLSVLGAPFLSNAAGVSSGVGKRQEQTGLVS